MPIQKENLASDHYRMDRNEIEMLVEKHISRGLGIVAEEMIKTQETVTKLKKAAMKQKKRSSNANSTLSAEITNVWEAIKLLQHETNDIQTYNSVSHGTMMAEIELLKDECHVLQMGHIKTTINAMKKQIQFLIKRSIAVATHQVQLGKTMENLIRVD